METNSKRNWLRRLGILLIILVVGVFFMSLFYRLPDISGRNQSFATQDGVKVKILTNSLASNDVAAVHAGYSKYRRKLLRCGVRLFELDESLKERKAKPLPGCQSTHNCSRCVAMNCRLCTLGLWQQRLRGQTSEVEANTHSAGVDH